MKPFLLVILTLAPGLLAQQPSPATNDDAALRALEERWDIANLKGDAATLETIFADNFFATDSDGIVRTRAQVIGALKSRNLTYDSAKTDEVKITLYGNAAVVSGRWRGRYTHLGKTVNLQERFTNFYVRLDGQWRCVASHGSAIK